MRLMLLVLLVIMAYHTEGQRMHKQRNYAEESQVEELYTEESYVEKPYTGHIGYT
jgi:hypothetical protein